MTDAARRPDARRTIEAPAGHRWRTAAAARVAALLAGALVAAALARPSAAAPATGLPAHTGAIVDQVGMIDAATRARLELRLRDLQARARVELAVVVVESLGGDDIESYATALAAAWALGGDGRRGALLLVAPNEGKVAIQAGPELRASLTDAAMERIIAGSIIPPLAADDFAGGLGRGVDAIALVLTGGSLDDLPLAPAGAAAARAAGADGAPSAGAAAPGADLDPGAPAAAPRLDRRVVDDAGLLGDAERRALTEKLAALEGKTTDQLVVVTVASLGGQSIEDLGISLGRKYGVGQKGKNNGVLLIVAPNERKVRIEVGYGLEGTLTDAVSKLIIERAILPRFRDGDMPGGIARGVDEIVAALTEDPAEWQRRAAGPPESWLHWLGMRALTAAAIVAFLAAGLTFLVVIGLVVTTLLIKLGVLLGLIPAKKDRTGRWQTLNAFEMDSSSSGSSGGSSGSSGSDFSGGGGDFGGGGASGSW